MKFIANKFKCTEDHEGEVKLTLVISQTQADMAKVKNLPVLKNLIVNIEVES